MMPVEIPPNAWGYLTWLKQCIYLAETDRMRFEWIIEYLFTIDYWWTIPTDDNMAMVGLKFRRTYMEGSGDTGIAGWNDDRCTVLEFILAVAYSGETQLLGELDGNDRTYVWFWVMFEHLHLDQVTPGDYETVYNIIMRLLGRTYDPSGEGCLSGPLGRPVDMRTVIFWWQFNFWVTDVYHPQLWGTTPHWPVN